MITVLMPMAGRGSRFSSCGFIKPKPLIEISGKPFFWWATESVLSNTRLPVSLIFVILEEHALKHSLEDVIYSYYPSSKVVKLRNVTSGSLETAIAGMEYADLHDPIIINDCDHLFKVKKLDEYIDKFNRNLLDGFLCNFKSKSSAYSYAKYNSDGYLERTVEKIAITDQAIAGAYGFRSAQLIKSYYAQYKIQCPYDELFISGIYNLMVESGCRIEGLLLDSHTSFGTPEEYTVAAASLNLRR